MARSLRMLLASLLGVSALSLATAAAGGTVHEVADGESLWAIAHKYGVSVDAIREKNSLASDAHIRPGQKLGIPDTRTASKTAVNGSGHAHTGSDHTQSKTDAKAPSKSKSKIDAKSSSKGETKAEAKSSSNNETKTDDEHPTRAASWVTQKPSAATQVQKSAKDRGVNPCNTPDPGFGVYDHWSRESSIGQLIMPQRGGITKDGGFDVMFHFHGHEPVRKEWVQVMDGAVLVGIDLGIGSGPYSEAFAAPDSFKRLVESVEQAVGKKTGHKNAHVRHVGLSSWSAGYGAVQEIIGQPYGKKLVEVVILLDSLHSGYQGELINEVQIKPFVEYAEAAAHGDKFMFVSHSSIIPPGYASTTETANFLIYKVGGKPQKTQPRRADPMGLDLISRYNQGNFHVRGYSGNDKMDHCAHIGLLRDVLKVHIKPRWKTPRGSGRSSEPHEEGRVADRE